jgi:hypothetical protein
VEPDCAAIGRSSQIRRRPAGRASRIREINPSDASRGVAAALHAPRGFVAIKDKSGFPREAAFFLPGSDRFRRIKGYPNVGRFFYVGTTINF